LTIPLGHVLRISDTREYKVHLASWNGEAHPLDVFVRSREEWDQWNTWRSAKNDFNRTFILSLIDFYSEPDVWLFGGVYEVLARKPVDFAHSYTVRRDPAAEPFVGRLKVRFRRPGRIKSILLENHFDRMSIAEMLPEPFSGEPFPGYEDICHDFPILEQIFKHDRPDWRAALENIKGIYLIVDKSNGRKYVGSAYGDAGVWARWASYLGTGHGWTDELTKLIRREGIKYARENFRFSLLEFRPSRTDDHLILERESYWKEALQSRKPLGYNKN